MQAAPPKKKSGKRGRSSPCRVLQRQINRNVRHPATAPDLGDNGIPVPIKLTQGRLGTFSFRSIAASCLNREGMSDKQIEQ